MKNNKAYHFLPLTIKLTSGRSIDHLIKLKKKNYKNYFNAQHLLYKLSPIERCFYEFLIENMDTRSRVFINNKLKALFIVFLEVVVDTGTKTITLERVAQIVPKLKELGLIIASGDRGLYYVNPKYVHKGSEKSRQLNLKNIIHEHLIQNLPINMLVDAPDEKLDAK